MTVKEVFEKGIKEANEKRNNWVSLIKIDELKHCYVTQELGSETSFTLFLNDAQTISLIRPISNQVGINIDSNYFIYANSLKIVDMQTYDEFIISKDGLVKSE